ncbi:hypothetical protein MNBD_ALPHA05-283 [hydrothermal vent metagenome]|uniref:Uncharacterized protein n=1 Tax=hydrothermal vent metagenome TaxID=652676 RepID=A0A3B0SGC1_9ZZZZ
MNASHLYPTMLRHNFAPGKSECDALAFRRNTIRTIFHVDPKTGRRVMCCLAEVPPALS